MPTTFTVRLLVRACEQELALPVGHALEESAAVHRAVRVFFGNATAHYPIVQRVRRPVPLKIVVVIFEDVIATAIHLLLFPGQDVLHFFAVGPPRHALPRHRQCCSRLTRDYPIHDGFEEIDTADLVFLHVDERFTRRTTHS